MLLILLIRCDNGKIDLADIKSNQAKFKSYLGEIKKEKNQKSKKALCTILKCFTKQDAKLLNFMMIILQWYLRQNIEQRKEQDLKY